MNLRIGKQYNVHTFEELDKNGKVIGSFYGPCNMILRGQRQYSVGTKQLLSSISVYDGGELKAAYSFFEYLFSKEFSPYRNHLEYVSLERDDKGNPSYVYCSDIDKTSNHAFCSLIASIRVAYECPGSMLVFEEAIKNGAEPHVAYVIANIFSATKSGDGFDLDKLVVSPYATGWHTPLVSGANGNYFPMNVKKPGTFDSRPLSNVSANYVMSSPFVTGGNPGLSIDECYSVIVNTYKGEFRKLYDSIRVSYGEKEYRNKKPLPMAELIKLVSSKCNINNKEKKVA